MKTSDLLDGLPDELPTSGSVGQWAKTGIASRATLWRAIDCGDLEAFRPTSKTIILRSSILKWLGRYCAAGVRWREKNARRIRWLEENGYRPKISHEN